MTKNGRIKVLFFNTLQRRFPMKIAIVGAGPRGLMTMERLVAWQQRDHFPLTISIYDPAGIGGKVWQPTQPLALIMNTIPIQITLFTDRSVRLSGGPVTTGPNLYEWAHTIAADWLPQQSWPTQTALQQEAAQLHPRGYATRALYGAYTHWFYEYVTTHASAETEIHFSPMMVTDLQWQDNHTVLLQTAAGTTTFNGAVLALGYSENQLPADQQKLADHAAANKGLHYIPQRNPADADLSNIDNTDTVILRGLGLSFFDYTTLLTAGRGGTFTESAEHGLKYHPSGREPRILASSRSGFPYRAKGYNEKDDGEEDTPQFLTAARLAAWKKAGHVAGAEFWQLLQAEVEYVYYSLLVQREFSAIDLSQLQDQMRETATPTAAAQAAGVPTAQLWQWPTILAPRKATDAAQYADYLLNYLIQDYQEAEKGTKTGPFTSALEVLRDMRDPIRQIVETGLLTDDDYDHVFLHEFQPANDFLSIGPPAHRIQELAALIAAGVVTIVGPDMTVSPTTGGFTVSSQAYSDRTYRGNVLIEARLPAVHYQTAINPLLRQMNAHGLLHGYVLHPSGQTVPTGAVTVNRQNAALITATGQELPNVALYGIPTEGYHWLTTASPRPDVNDVSLRETDALVAALIQHLS
jgi:hypothetical protein